jgi:hypothetical protein
MEIIFSIIKIWSSFFYFLKIEMALILGFCETKIRFFWNFRNSTSLFFRSHRLDDGCMFFGIPKKTLVEGLGAEGNHVNFLAHVSKIFILEGERGR